MAVPVLGKVSEAKTFIEESVTELKKVTWPDYAQLKNATGVVLLFVTLISLVIWLMDKTVSTLITAIMSIFGA